MNTLTRGVQIAVLWIATLTLGAGCMALEEERFGNGLSVPSDRVAAPQDVESIDAIVHALYDVISGPAGPRDWGRDRTLYHPDAGWHMPVGLRRSPSGETSDERVLRVMSLEQYQAQASSYFDENAFYEVEIARRVERFGDIAQVFSTYESRHSPEGEPFTRGINSIQLMHDGSRWWVVSILWNGERDGLTIPEPYLHSGS